MMETTRREKDESKKRKKRWRIGKKKNEGFFCAFVAFSLGWFGTISKKNKTVDYSSSLCVCVCVPDPPLSLLPLQMVVILLYLSS
jgi:hypothetical protein